MRTPDSPPEDRSARRTAGPRTLRAARTLLCAAAAAALAGCISVKVGSDEEPAEADRFHALDRAELGPGATSGAPLGAPPPAAAKGPLPVIAVRAFRARDRFDRHVVRHDGPGLVTPLDRDFWADEPDAAVTEAVREALASCGRYAAAVDPSDAHRAQLALDGVLLDFTWSADPPSARFAARFTLSDAATGQVLSTSVHEAVEPFSGPATSGLGPAMSRAAGRALRAAMERW